MESLKLHILALALLSVLLVNLEAVKAVSIQDTLPTLVLDDELAKAKAPESSSENVQSNPNPLEPAKQDSKESKLVPYSTNLETEVPVQPVASEKPREAEVSESSTAGSPKEVSTSQTAISETTTPLAVSKAAEPAGTERDINVLLANKDDAENDLASPTQKPADPKPLATEETKKTVDLDAPVDTVKDNDDRLHYAFGDKPIATEEPKPSAAETTPASADAPAKDGMKPEEKPSVAPAAAYPVDKKEVEEEKKVVKKAEEADAEVPTTNIVVDPSTPDNPDSSEKKETEVSKPKEEEPISSPTSTTVVESASSGPPTSTTITAEPEKPEKETEATGKSVTPESSSTTVTTTAASSTTTPPPAKEKPESVPSILAVALGTALGAAVNPLLPKARPEISSTTSTTKAPTTVRKSSTDRWDRWTPTTSSTAAPTRRRPILPSIRRRFRPYNRFSPFPWGGADSYSPAAVDSDFIPSDLTPKAASGSSSTTTSKPKRRHQTNGTSTTSAPAEESDEVPAKPDDVPPTTSTRRRPNGKENRRRHHHHHHHHNHHDFNGRRRHHSGPKSEAPYPSERPAFSESSPFDFGQQRPFSGPGFNFFNSPASSAGSGFDLLNPFSGWLDDLKPKPTLSRPAIHNPPTYSGSPRPLGRPPIPVEGAYDEHEPHRAPHRPGRHDEYDHDHDHHHEHDHHHDNDHHHHDCHDHDYDHHHNNRPRPQREPYRPPVGGDYETPGYGRRPNRPYNRRDQAEAERNRESESSEASPSLYNTRNQGVAGAPRRVPSIFSPFDSLFGALDDELFSLRSTFIDVPPKPESHAFDAIVSSPKISLPGVAAKESEAEKEKEAAAKPAASAPQEASGSSNVSNNESAFIGRNSDFMKRGRAFG